MRIERLTWIDETNRSSYYFLEESDRCLFLGDFYGGKDWTAGPTNQLIKNYKRTPTEIRTSAKPSALQHYKDQAVLEIADALRRIFLRESVEQKLTFVPIPTSKVPGDADYDDRLERTLRRAFRGYNADIRPLLRQTTSTAADHRSGRSRLKYDELLAITEIDPAQLMPAVRGAIVLFDDVLTSGKHYKVAKTRILEVLPEQNLFAVFVARCIHPSPFDDLDELC